MGNAKLKERIAELEGRVSKLKARASQQGGLIKEQMDSEKEFTQLQKERNILDKKITKAKEGKKGFGKFLVSIRGGLARGQINKRINEQRKFTQLKSQEKLFKQQASTLKARAELQKYAPKPLKLGSTDIFGGDIDIRPHRMISEKDIFG